MKTAQGTESALKLRPMTSFVIGAVATLCVAAPLAHAAGALPAGGHFVAGSGSINGTATSVTVNQSSSRGVVDWNSFSIGNGNHVSINNGSGATLNRVTGGTASSILGSLSGTGSVYLIDPQGIVVGSTGVIATGGRFVASTLDTSNASFMKGGPLTLTGSSKASVVNLGQIGSTHGDVFLIATGQATNNGTIQAPNGTAELAAGSVILLHDSSTGRQVFVQLGDGGTASNGGSISAAQISLQAADGNVFAMSGNHGATRATGTARRQGHVWLVAGAGTVGFDSNISAHNANGSGGTVDTVAATGEFGGLVQAGLWNITTPQFLMDENGSFRTVNSSLNAGTSIYVRAIGGSASSSSGDIGVYSLTWNGPASLTLAAYRDVTLEQGLIQNRGSGSLTLRADSAGIDNGGSINTTGAAVDWSQSTGTVRLFYDSPSVGGRSAFGPLIANAAWAPGSYSPVRNQITAYQLVNTLADLQAINNNLSGYYALGHEINASASSNGSFVPIGDGNTPFTGIFDGLGHPISSLTLVKTVPFKAPYGNTTVQGLFGEVGAGAIVNEVAVSGTENVADLPDFGRGMLAGVNYGTIENDRTSGSIAGASSQGEAAGGLVGVNFGTVARSSSSVNINVGPLGSGEFIADFGGLVGRNQGAVSQSYATGSLNAAGVTGGLVGNNGGAITQSYAAGSVVDNGAHINLSEAGGLVGENNGSITQSYATASVHGDAAYAVGGLVGADNNTGTIDQSFATGPLSLANPVQGNSYLGGIAGVLLYTGVIDDNVYWNAQTTGVTQTVGRDYGSGAKPPPTNGLTTAQMSMQSSFPGYNFGPNGVWAMPAGSTHPVLAWQLIPFH